jgi:hypothetical protein
MRTALLLRKLLACERGLVEAYGDVLRRGGRTPAELELLTRGVEAHQEHARQLGEQLRLLDEPPPEDGDDLWVAGVDDPHALLIAEQVSHDTWHDALLDFPEAIAETFAKRIGDDHHELMRAWEALLATAAEPSITL